MKAKLNRLVERRTECDLDSGGVSGSATWLPYYTLMPNPPSSEAEALRPTIDLKRFLKDEVTVLTAAGEIRGILIRVDTSAKHGGLGNVILLDPKDNRLTIVKGNFVQAIAKERQ